MISFVYMVQYNKLIWFDIEIIEIKTVLLDFWKFNLTNNE